MPRCSVAWAWGSRSTRQTRCPAAASAALRFTAVVVFPTPPFWFMMAMDRIGRGQGSEVRGQRSEVRGQRSEVRGQGQRSGIRSEKGRKPSRSLPRLSPATFPVPNPHCLRRQRSMEVHVPPDSVAALPHAGFFAAVRRRFAGVVEPLRRAARSRPRPHCPTAGRAAHRPSCCAGRKLRQGRSRTCGTPFPRPTARGLSGSNAVIVGSHSSAYVSQSPSAMLRRSCSLHAEHFLDNGLFVLQGSSHIGRLLNVKVQVGRVFRGIRRARGSGPIRPRRDRRRPGNRLPWRAADQRPPAGQSTSRSRRVRCTASSR